MSAADKKTGVSSNRQMINKIFFFNLIYSVWAKGFKLVEKFFPPPFQGKQSKQLSLMIPPSLYMVVDHLADIRGRKILAAKTRSRKESPAQIS